MRVKKQLKKPSKLKDRFKILIDSLRERQNFRDKINPRAVQVESSKRSETDKQLADIFPVTQNKNIQLISQVTNQKNSQREESSVMIDKNSTFALIEDNQIVEYQKQQGDMKQESEEEHFEVIDNRRNRLNPQVGLECPFNQGRVGTIKSQIRSVNDRFAPKNNQLKRQQKIKYMKMANKQIYKQKFLSSESQKEKVLIRQVNGKEMVKFWNLSKKLKYNMSHDQYYNFFQKMVEYLSIKINCPIIKKYKNCIYLGQNASQNGQYQGIIYYFDQKLYYGQFVNGVKHGHGVEINFRDNTKFAGNFSGGKKNGYFFVQKNQQNYYGILQHGLYHGHGKLVTQEFIYSGNFEDGKRSGFGEQYHPQTGLKLIGYFKNDIYQNLNESQPRVLDYQQQLYSKVDRIITSSKSEMIDFKIDLTNKLLKNHRNQSQQEFTNRKKQNQLVNQIPFVCQETGSLSDLLFNNKKQIKYDFDSSRLAKRLPKIYLQGIKQSQIRNHGISILTNKNSRALNQQINLSQRKNWSQNCKPIHFQQKQTKFDQFQSPLIKKGRKSIHLK